MTKNNKMS